MSDIPTLAIKKLTAELGSRANDKLRLAERFIDYCMQSGAYHGENPFTRFFENHSSNRKRKDNTPPKVPLGRIDHKEDVLLNEYIEKNHFTEPKSLAILMAKEAHMNASEIADLKWKHIHFDGNIVFVENHHPEYAGSLHNFSRPVLPFGSKILAQHYKKLLEKY